MTQNVIYCIHCGYANSAEARFCLQCGQAVVRLDGSAATNSVSKEALPEQPKPEATPTNKSTAKGKTVEELECPYCCSKMQVPTSVDQLICLECAASFTVVRLNGLTRLEILSF